MASIRKSGRAPIALALAFGFAFVLAASLVSATEPTPAESARAWLDRVRYTYEDSAGWRDLLRTTAVVARIRVDSIDGPLWNSSSGDAWSGNDEMPASVYSRVNATVEETWVGNLEPGKIEILVMGDRSKRFEGSGLPPYESVSGGFTPDESFLLLLKRAEFPFENHVDSAWTVAMQFEGNWRIDAGTAKSADLAWSGPVGDLRTILTSPEIVEIVGKPEEADLT